MPYNKIYKLLNYIARIYSIDIYLYKIKCELYEDYKYKRHNEVYRRAIRY